MRYFKAFLLLSAATLASTASTVHENGQPGCRTKEELNIQIYRNFWDSTAYWKCETLGEPAVLERCPENMGYLDSIKDCVVWEDWRWEEPMDPPSFPTDDE